MNCIYCLLFFTATSLHVVWHRISYSYTRDEIFEQEWPPMAYIFEYLVPRWEGLGDMTLL